MSLPKTISPCPILDALFEIRFSTKMHPNAVFGLIYNALQADFGESENLPILQLPEAVRAADPGFRFKPHYRIFNENFVVQIGPDVLTISSYPKYAGWTVFSNKILDVLDKVEKVGIIDSILRIGIRYINFFGGDIFKDLNLKILIGENSIENKSTVFRTEIEQTDFSSTLQIANNVNNQDRLGSILDIDTFRENGLENFFLNKADIIGNGHEREKELFFSLLKKDFLTTLNPVY
jgi:uncharacterized protein (TIGR04255 family)